MSHLKKYRNHYLDTDYYILCKVDEPTKFKLLCQLIQFKTGIEMHVYKKQIYNNQCLVVWFTKHIESNLSYVGPITVYELPDGKAFKFLNGIYEEASPSVYELASAFKGIAITKEDVDDFANKVKSIKERYSNHSEVAKYGHTNSNNISSGKPSQ